MKLAKTLLATTLALTAASTFAASKHDQAHNTAKKKLLFQLKSKQTLQMLLLTL